MAIQFRRGKEEDFVPDNLLPGEPAYVTDTNRLFVGGEGGATEYAPANDYAHLATPLTSGVSTAQTLTLNPPLTAYTPGLMLAVNFYKGCGGGRCTLNINGLGARNIRPFKDYAGVSFAAGVHVIVYDGEQWRMQPDAETMLDLAHPVGSIYMSMEDVNPGELFGGIWEAFAQGQFVLGANAGNPVGSTGGTARETLTVAQLPNIKGSIHDVASQGPNEGIAADGVFSMSEWGAYSGYGTSAPNNGRKDSIHLNFGSDRPHNNMPPYIVCYIWRRTA